MKKQLREIKELGWWTAIYHLCYWKWFFGECGFESAAKWAFWKFILESDSLNHSFPGTAGQWKLAASRESLLPPSRRGVQNSPALVAGRPQREEGGTRGGERSQVHYYCGEFSVGPNVRRVNKGPLAAPAVGFSEVDQTWPCSPGTFSEEGREGIGALGLPSVPFFAA